MTTTTLEYAFECSATTTKTMTNMQGESVEGHDQDEQHSKKHSPRSRATNDEMKSRPFRTPIGDFFKFRCNSACHFFGPRTEVSWKTSYTQAKSRLANITIGEYESFVESFVCEEDLGALTSQHRLHRLEDYFFHIYNGAVGGGKKPFSFTIGTRQVCETSVAFLLGYIRFSAEGILGKVSSTWKDSKLVALDAKKRGVCLSELRSEDLKLTFVCAGADCQKYLKKQLIPCL